MKTYQNLIGWQRAIELVEAVYLASRAFPIDERYGLTVQIRRAAVSIPSNIAEGQGRSTARDFDRFLAIAYGSLLEVETQILIAERLGYLDETSASPVLAIASEVGRLVNGLRASLSASIEPR